MARSDDKVKLPLSARLKNITPKQVLHASRFYLFLAVLAIVRALSAYIFIVPNGFAPSGITGLSSIIYNAVIKADLSLEPWMEWFFDPSVTAMVLNIPLFIAAFVVLDKKFAFNTFFCVTVYAVFMAVFRVVDLPTYAVEQPESGYKLLASLAGGALAGLSLGFMLRYNTSLGGTDVIGKLIYAKNPVADVQWLIFMCDCVIVIASGALGLIGEDLNRDATAIITAVVSPMIYSFLSQLTTSQVADVLQSGFQSSLVFNVISDKHNEIAEHITREMVEEVLKKFIGTIEQVPPVFSACKVDGKRAYDLARKGDEVELKAKTLVIDDIELLECNLPEIKIRVVCSKGTYIRALARDIGQALDSGAHLTGLIRTRVGDVKLEDCMKPEDFEQWLDKQDIKVTND